MIAKVGLLDPTTYDPHDKNEAYRLGAAAWAKSKAIALEGAGLLNAIAAFVLDAVQSAIALPLAESNLVADVPLKAVAVWDTVGSLGIPKYVDDRRYDLFRFVDNALSPKVAFGLHAMAIDEQRIDFPVTRWQPRAGVQEVWFVGAHADVGGGYCADESGLSDAALGWMLRKLQDLGLMLLDPLPVAPRSRVLDTPIHEPWKRFPFDQLPRGPRLVGRADTVHASVMQRWNAGYRPAALGLTGTGIPGWVVDATMI
jgi:glutathione S-transferase